MSEPRYYVAETSGHYINVSNHASYSPSSRPAHFSWLILDRVYCHRAVAEFTPGGWTAKGARRKAYEYADELNRIEEAAA